MDAAAQDVSLFRERAGERTRKLVQPGCGPVGRVASPFVAEVGGVNIHAGRWRCLGAIAPAPQALERLCRYVAGPPIAHRLPSKGSPSETTDVQWLRA